MHFGLTPSFSFIRGAAIYSIVALLARVCFLLRSCLESKMGAEAVVAAGIFVLSFQYNINSL